MASLGKLAGREYLERGARVLARKNERFELFPGTVVRAPFQHGDLDATYAIRFDDGSRQANVKREHITVISQLSSSLSVDDRVPEVTTTAISASISASDLRVQLMLELDTGDITVTRSGPGTRGEYAWTVTFVGRAEGEKIPKFGSIPWEDGNGPAVKTKVVSRPGPAMIGTVYLFTRDAGGGATWTEQAMLAPKYVQGADLYGAGGLALSSEYVIAGAPNRDPFVSGKNAGAGFMFDAGFLNVKFASRTWSVSEHNGTIDLEVQRCSPSCRTGTVSDTTETVMYMIGDGEDSGLEAMVSAPGAHLGTGTCPYTFGCASTATGRSDCHLRR